MGGTKFSSENWKHQATADSFALEELQGNLVFSQALNGGYPNQRWAWCPILLNSFHQLTRNKFINVYLICGSNRIISLSHFGKSR